MRALIDFVLHMDKHLADITLQYGSWTYAILFAIIFCETGLVVTPFLPGDSLLFAAGAVASLGNINVFLLGLLLIAAAILGDTVNYHIGKSLGARITRKDRFWLKKKHLDRTHAFFEKHGGKTIIFARFIPIVRTFAPFVAGMGAMTYSKFILYNVVGAIIWVVLLLGAGYTFGQVEVVKKNFSVVIFAIIFISILPGIIEFIRARRAGKAEKAAEKPAAN